MSYKLGDKIKFKHWFEEKTGIVSKIGKRIIFLECDGKEYWKHLDENGEIIGK